MGWVKNSGQWIKFHGSKAFKWNKPDFNPLWHLYVCGTTGSGKTNTVMQILSKYYADIPYMIVEPTPGRQYKKLQGLSKRPFHVFSIGEDRGAKLELNPFYIPYGGDFTGHIELLKACLSDAIESRESLVYNYIERSIPEVYFDKGWNKNGTHPMLKERNDYIGEEHYFYFPRMRDLYDKVIQLAENSDFQNGGENKGTLTELVKSYIRNFLTGPLGVSFNTYKNDLYNIVNDNIVFEIPNVMSSSVVAILNFLMANIISISGRREDVNRECKHVTVFEEAQLLFSADEDDKTHKSTGKKLEQLLSTGRKFGESIIIVNQDPAAIHKSVVGNIKQRFIHQLASSKENEAILRAFCTDYRIKLNDILNLDKYCSWFSAQYDQYKALKYNFGEFESKSSTTKERGRNLYRETVLNFAGLDTINEQLAATINFLDAVSVSGEYGLEVKRFKNALSAKFGEMGKIEKDILPEYMAYLTCVAYVKLYIGRIPADSYGELTQFYEKALCSETVPKLPQILKEITPLFLNVLKEILC